MRYTGRHAWVFLLGAVAAFVACCLLGYLGRDRVLFANFSRFHVRIAPQSLFYPTACQVRALGRQQLESDRIAVVLGGNSIFYGVGQRRGHVWTDRLQELLGNRYRVLNLAVHGGGTYEFGGVGAEMLLADRPKLIFVSNLGPGYMPEEPDGGIYRYLFWDAYAKGLLTSDAERREALAWVKRKRKRDEAFHELRRGARLDGWLHVQDLWTRVTHDHVSTVWNRLLDASFLRPRRVYEDIEHPVSVSRRYPPTADAREMAVIRAWITGGRDLIGDPYEGPANPYVLERAARRVVPTVLRPHTLLVVVRESPHYLDRLTNRERDQYERLLTATAATVEKVGVSGMVAGRGLTADDFSDRCHPSESGGARLAEEIAPRVRKLAEQLGYVLTEKR